MWEVEEAGSRKQRGGLRAEGSEGRGGAGSLAMGCELAKPHMKQGSSNSHSGVWVQGSVSCVCSYQRNRWVTSERVRVTPVMEAEGSLLAASPLLSLGKERPFGAAFRPPTPSC